MSKPISKTAEEWEAYETQIATDPENFALCRAHMEEARTSGEQREWGYRLLALRKTALVFKSVSESATEPRELKTRQQLRFNFYLCALKNRRAQMEKHRKNPNYKSQEQRKNAREWLDYIRECQRTGAAINYQSRPHGCD